MKKNFRLQTTNRWLSLSVVMATFNSARTLDLALKAIANQEYLGSIEIIVADGGSTDETLAIAKQYRAIIVPVPKEKQGAEYNKGMAVAAAKNEVLVFLDHDNILPNKRWLTHMVQPLIDDKDIFGAGCLRFEPDPSMTSLDRYFALIGSPDPIPFFFNKSGHQSWLYSGFHLRGQLIDEKKNYYIVTLDPERLPALGGNGSVLRRSLIKKAKANPDDFFHIDIHVDLARKGYLKYAFVKETVKHLTNNNLIPFLARRRYFIVKYHFEDHSRRRYSVYEPQKDKWLLVGYIIYSATFVGPLYHAVLGFLKRPDPAWFIHPVMCFSMLIVYGIPTVREELRRVFLAK